MRKSIQPKIAVLFLIAGLAFVAYSNGLIASQSTIPTFETTHSTVTALPLSGNIRMCCADDLMSFSGGGGSGGGGLAPQIQNTTTTTTGILAQSQQQSPSTATGIVVPLYMYPGGVWTDLIADKEANPSVPVIGIVNPSSGVGASSSSTYLSSIRALQKAGILVLGYDWSNYGVIGGGGQHYTTMADIETNMSDYSSWYHVNGTFFDGESYTVGYEQDYQLWVNYAQNLGQTYTMANPGTDTTASYVGITNNINIYEDSALPSIAFLGGWHTNYAKTNFALIAYGVTGTPTQSYIDQASQYVGYLYISDQGPGYQSLPSYMTQEMQELATANG